MLDPQKLQKGCGFAAPPMFPPGEPAHQALVAATPLPTSEIRRAPQVLIIADPAGAVTTRDGQTFTHDIPHSRLTC